MPRAISVLPSRASAPAGTTFSPASDRTSDLDAVVALRRVLDHDHGVSAGGHGGARHDGGGLSMGMTGGNALELLARLDFCDHVESCRKSRKDPPSARRSHRAWNGGRRQVAIGGDLLREHAVSGSQKIDCLGLGRSDLGSMLLDHLARFFESSDQRYGGTDDMRR